MRRPLTARRGRPLLKDGKPFLAISTPGGDGHDRQILNDAAGRHGVRDGPPGDSRESVPGQLEIENGVPAKTLDELRARGHVLRVVGPYSMSTGVVW